MSISNQIKNQHLLWRAGFGPAVEQLPDLSVSNHKLYKALRKASDNKPDYLDVSDNYLKGLVMGITDVTKMEQKPDVSEEKKKEIQKKSRESIKNLNLAWLNEMTNSS